MRVVAYGSTIAMLTDSQLFTFPSTLTGGYPGVGAWGNTGGAIASVQIGARCMTAPNPVDSTHIAVSAYPTSISMSWPEVAQPPDVTTVGIVEWDTMRNGSFYGITPMDAAWADPNVSPSSSYSYSVAPVTFHGVAGAYSTALNVGTPSTLNVDPVRTGVRPLGGQYRLYQSGSATPNIWVSRLYPAASGLSGEAIYVYYDSTANILHFRDGSFWVMGCASSGEEQDAGTLYPTILEDRNGNQVLIEYGAGVGTAAFAVSPAVVDANSSSRIVSIEDTRATGSPRATYNFAYNPPDANGAIHLASISNTIGTGETYQFQYLPLSLRDPWTNSASTTNSSMMVAFTATPMNTTYGFVYDTSGQITVMEMPYGGYMRWTYGANNYYWTTPAGNNITLNAVTGRYLASASSAWMTYAGGSLASEWQYPISYTPAVTGESSVAGSCVADATAQSKRCWTFANGASTGIIVATDLQRWGTVSGTATELKDDALTYSSDAAGNSYLFQDLTTDNPGTANQVYSQTRQTVDQYGNTTQSSIWDYSSSTPSGVATRKYTTTFQNACSISRRGSDQCHNLERRGGRVFVGCHVSERARPSGTGNCWNDR